MSDFEVRPRTQLVIILSAEPGRVELTNIKFQLGAPNQTMVLRGECPELYT